MENKYHFIIVGAGSAGCVIANRLSEDPSHNVLLVEAGAKDTNPLIHIPAAYSELNHTKTDWGLFTAPQSHVDNRIMYQPRGKTLGGSSSTNAMAYVRGNHLDYDTWSELGANGWSAKEVLPFFIKSENNEQIENEYHGKNGPLNVTYPQGFRTPLADAFVAACVEKGIPKNEDYNGKNQEGASRLQFTIKNGKRHSTAQAFLSPILNTRKNLTVLTHAQVMRIIIENDKAVGIEISHKGSIQNINASKEIILSAGAFGSPQLLLLSGIGSKAQLTKHKIDIVKQLEGVGENLHDHLFVGISCLSKWKGTFNSVNKPWNKIKHLIQYGFTRKGPLSMSPLEANAFITTSPELKQPDMQLMFAPIHFGNEQDFANGTYRL